jgi:hypothetical protein
MHDFSWADSLQLSSTPLHLIGTNVLRSLSLDCKELVMLSTRHLMYRAIIAAISVVALGFAHAKEPIAHARTAIYLPAERAQADTAAIERALADDGLNVVTLARDGDTKSNYARRVAAKVRALGEQGVAPEDISVIGAGIGSETAILASSLVGQSGVSYVLLGHCDWHLKDAYQFRMSGRVLGIHDASDTASHSCRPLWNNAPRVSAQREVVVNTGLGAALFDTPRDEWMRPAVAWATRESVDVGAIHVSMANPE